MQLIPDQTVVLVCEKRAQYEATIQPFLTEFPGVQFFGVITHTTEPHTFRQRLPRNMPISAVPTISDPQWEITDQPVVDAAGARVGIDARILLRGADMVICATDADREGAHAFRNLTRHYLDDPQDTLDFPAIRPWGLDPNSITAEIHANRTTAGADFRAVVAQGDAKRFFDYNWAINAMPLFAPLLARVGVPQESRWMSKYALQLLFELQRLNSTLTDSDILKLMSTWTGTGKHRLRRSEFASAASRATIVEQLIGMGLLERVNPDDRPRRYAVSKAGHRFLGMLHPRCRDVDLPFRIHNWGEDWPASRPALETYIRTFFGRQRRFASRHRC